MAQITAFRLWPQIRTGPPRSHVLAVLSMFLIGMDVKKLQEFLSTKPEGRTIGVSRIVFMKSDIVVYFKISESEQWQRRRDDSSRPKPTLPHPVALSEFHRLDTRCHDVHQAAQTFGLVLLTG